jgi:thioredoxin type arsenate reductase
MSKKTIYFLCTGNSCRSQMAEGWAKKHLGVEWEVKSAGIEAHGLNPNAVKAMKEAGIDISNQTSDIIDPEILNNADLVVTLCGDAADKCPVTPPKVNEFTGALMTQLKQKEQKKKNGPSSNVSVMKLVIVYSVLLKLVSKIESELPARTLKHL